MTAIQSPDPLVMASAIAPLDLIAKYDRRLPRYTSYPSAPHFQPLSDDRLFRQWLAVLPSDAPISLYLHIPFCNSLCWYCGCHTSVINRKEPVIEYAHSLIREIDLIGAAIGHRPHVRHLHWGGGTPTMIRAPEMELIMAALNRNFSLDLELDHSIELDPRTLTDERALSLAELGINRASLGVQDFDPIVQESVNRTQSYGLVAAAVRLLRQAGIGTINFDLLYGLPFQSVQSVVDTVKRAADLEPDRIALFGYAHVPWMKRHQKLLPEASLPGPNQRFLQANAAAEALTGRGYRRVGFDHFVLPHDPLSQPNQGDRVTRNFQGYTNDNCSVLLGFGTSSISQLPQGYIQNTTDNLVYRQRLSEGHLPCGRGLAFAGDDRLRGAVIERLMCDMEVDLAEVARTYLQTPGIFADQIRQIDEMTADGIVRRDGWRILVTESGRSFVRSIAALFDAYLAPADADGAPRHSHSI